MVDDLLRYFSIHAARTAGDIAGIQHVRWQVYCREFHYEREEDCVDEREADAYDATARHAFVVHNKSGQIAGCVRIISAADLAAGQKLPIEEAGRHTFHTGPQFLERYPCESLFEVSRLAVAPGFRRRAGETGSPYGMIAPAFADQNEERVLPLLSLALILCATALGELHQRENALAIMEPRLARLLLRFGVRFEQIGTLMEYHGRRAAFHTTVSATIEGMRPDLHRLFRQLRATLAGDLGLPCPAEPMTVQRR